MANKETLRTQFDHRKQMWKIVKKTSNGAGGWARFGTGWYYSELDAENKVKQLVESFPDQYQEG
jgi:hypothetical protein